MNQSTSSSEVMDPSSTHSHPHSHTHSLMSFRSQLMVAGPLGRVAHKYHNNNHNFSNFNDTTHETKRALGSKKTAEVSE